MNRVGNTRKSPGVVAEVDQTLKARLIYSALMNHLELSAADLRIYAALIDLGHDTYREEIAEYSGYGSWKVSECVRKLEAAGLILVERKRVATDERISKNFYYFVLPKRE